MKGEGDIFFKIQSVVKMHPSKSVLLFSYLQWSLMDILEHFSHWHWTRFGQVVPCLKDLISAKSQTKKISY